MNRALQDFAEAALGHNSEMSWSLSAPILRRQVTPVFRRCAAGDLSAEQALDIAVDFTMQRTSAIVESFNKLYNALQARVSEQLPDTKLPTMTAFQELFMGLNPEIEWVTDDRITRRELYPIFVRVAVGNLTDQEGLSTFCDQMSAKRDFYLETCQILARKLSEDIVALSERSEDA